MLWIFFAAALVILKMFGVVTASWLFVIVAAVLLTGIGTVMFFVTCMVALIAALAKIASR